MITTKSNKIILVAGISGEYQGDTLLELNDINSKWKEIRLPLKSLRFGHIAFEGTNVQMKIFCGKEFTESTTTYRLQVPIS